MHELLHEYLTINHDDGEASNDSDDSKTDGANNTESMISNVQKPFITWDIYTKLYNCICNDCSHKRAKFELNRFNSNSRC